MYEKEGKRSDSEAISRFKKKLRQKGYSKERLRVKGYSEVEVIEL